MGAVTIIGTGNMARGIGHRLADAGTRIVYAGRDFTAAKTLANEVGGDAIGLDEPITTDVVLLATPYAAALSIAAALGERLADRIVIDITNPLNGTYTDLATPPGVSGAEQIARTVPASTHVVKAFNTTFAGTLTAGEVAGQPLDVFLAGDFEPAKLAVAQLVTSAGMRPIDLGPLSVSRHLESTGLVHITAQQVLGTQFGTALKIFS
ncbi:putative dinucleotide-binding enzyme [Allocatelliglobosispora scoriae]|uniref:Putative dinucleotide-binding enzyme n=1 Tax=Allocatelliglobosispora scoriae TaxID=643052 RepID=A0A841BQR8_9ACTN|nr:NAD(P)-binding domain-containing protein [Allocatelliglobosispora scoriae]MBB5869160.1 putative dinucleotide-binding enzyme [Allocatelliglobosispora scoriae]